jgi:Ca2+-binding EF-hand superfamily protein
MESQEQNNISQKEPIKEEQKEDQKNNINISLSNINQTESKKEKLATKENEMSYEEYINSLEEDEKNKVKEIFELFDKNLDGGVDMKELKFIY